MSGGKNVPSLLQLFPSILAAASACFPLTGPYGLPAAVLGPSRTLTRLGAHANAFSTVFTPVLRDRQTLTQTCHHPLLGYQACNPYELCFERSNSKP